jgi:hypothetical protein
MSVLLRALQVKPGMPRAAFFNARSNAVAAAAAYMLSGLRYQKSNRCYDVIMS